MDEKWELKRTIQCAKCPWKVATNPHEIPHGYCETKHCGLANTIADPNDPLRHLGDIEFHIMACHHSEPGDEEMCVGWIYHQMGEGNNIRLRLKMMNCTNVKDLQVVGEQHETFEDTLPQNKTHRCEL